MKGRKVVIRIYRDILTRRQVEEGKGARRGSEANLEVEAADAGVREDNVATWVPPNNNGVVVVVVGDDEDVLDDRAVLENRQDWDYVIFIFFFFWVLVLVCHCNGSHWGKEKKKRQLQRSFGWRMRIERKRICVFECLEKAMFRITAIFFSQAFVFHSLFFFNLIGNNY